MKTFLVLVKAYASVMVKSKDEESALEKVTDSISFGDLEFDGAEIEKQLTDKKEIARLVKHVQRYYDEF